MAEKASTVIRHLYRSSHIIPVQICARCKGETHLTIHNTSEDSWQQGLEHVGSQHGANL